MLVFVPLNVMEPVVSVSTTFAAVKLLLKIVPLELVVVIVPNAVVWPTLATLIKRAASRVRLCAPSILPPRVISPTEVPPALSETGAERTIPRTGSKLISPRVVVRLPARSIRPALIRLLPEEVSRISVPARMLALITIVPVDCAVGKKTVPPVPAVIAPFNVIVPRSAPTMIDPADAPVVVIGPLRTAALPAEPLAYTLISPPPELVTSPAEVIVVPVIVTDPAVAVISPAAAIVTVVAFITTVPAFLGRIGPLIFKVPRAAISRKIYR